MHRPVVLSFSGSGHLLIYQCGVASRLLASRVAPSIVSFAGASGGATAAAACALLRSPDAIERFVEEHAMHCDGFGGLARSVLGVRPPTMIDREEGGAMPPSLSDDAAVRALAGSLFIGATECRTGRHPRRHPQPSPSQSRHAHPQYTHHHQVGAPSSPTTRAPTSSCAASSPPPPFRAPRTPSTCCDRPPALPRTRRAAESSYPTAASTE